MFTIGNHRITGRALLAPMAGVTDQPYRDICLSYGAAMATSEMLTSDTSLWQSTKSRTRLLFSKENSSSPKSVQIAGSEPQQLANAASLAVSHGAEIIDINMGCPAKKVCKKLAGSALLKNEDLVTSILNAVVKSVDVPVTLKTRTGWEPAKKNGVSVAKIAQDCGIQALTIHGRTRACRFNGNAEYDTIAEIVESVDIPVIANGDIDSAKKATLVLKYTNANAVMVGRAAYGNPWIFQQINNIDHGKLSQTQPNVDEVCKTLTSHLRALHEFYGPLKGLRIARKHFSWYCQKHLPMNDAEKKAQIRSFNTIEKPELQITFAINCFTNSKVKEEIAA